jgi:hypothetical protein
MLRPLRFVAPLCERRFLFCSGGVPDESGQAVLAVVSLVAAASSPSNSSQANRPSSGRWGQPVPTGRDRRYSRQDAGGTALANWADLLCRHVKDSKSQIANHKSPIQNPESKTVARKSHISNLKSKIANSHVEIGNSKIVRPKSKIENPKSKIVRRYPVPAR